MRKKFLFSKYKIRVNADKKSKAISLVMTKGLPCIRADISTDKSLHLIVKNKDKDKFINVFRENNISAEYTAVEGKLSILEKLKGRHGLLVGVFFLILVLLYSSKVVWKIEINGPKGIEEDVLKQLQDAGFGLGTYIPGVDYDSLHNRVLLNSDNLSWISINVVGNVAKVDVKEKRPQKNNVLPTYTNVVAKYDGYIESVKIIRGKKIVSEGHVVKKGDILISGIIDSQAEGVRYEQASGVINAYVNKSIFVKIPFATIKKEYTGKKFTEKSYKIYNFPINFLSKYGNQMSLYDTIEKKEKLCFFGISHIPIETQTVVYYEYVLKSVQLSISEAVDMAFVELRKEMDNNLMNAELIDKDIKTYYDSEAFYIECELYCIEDIAVEQEFFVTK